MIRAVDRNLHADDVLDTDTPRAGRPSTVRNRHVRRVGRLAAFYAAMPSTTVRGTIGSTAQQGQMTQPRLHGTNPPRDTEVRERQPDGDRRLITYGVGISGQESQGWPCAVALRSW